DRRAAVPFRVTYRAARVVAVIPIAVALGCAPVGHATLLAVDRETASRVGAPRASVSRPREAEPGAGVGPGGVGARKLLVCSRPEVGRVGLDKVLPPPPSLCDAPDSAAHDGGARTAVAVPGLPDARRLDRAALMAYGAALLVPLGGGFVAYGLLGAAGP